MRQRNARARAAQRAFHISRFGLYTFNKGNAFLSF